MLKLFSFEAFGRAGWLSWPACACPGRFIFTPVCLEVWTLTTAAVCGHWCSSGAFPAWNLCVSHQVLHRGRP